MTRVPTSNGSTDDLRRFDASGSGAASAPLMEWDFPLPAAGAEPFSAAVGASSEPMTERERDRNESNASEPDEEGWVQFGD